MDSQKLCLQMFILYFFTVFGEGNAECSKTAERDIKFCIYSLLPNFGLDNTVKSDSPKALRTTIYRMRESCKASKLVDAGKCVGDILDSCRGTTEKEQLLQRLFDKDALQETISYFCTNLDVYEEHTQCIADQHDDAVECSRLEYDRHQKKYRAHASTDVIIYSTCSYFEMATTCLTTFVNLRCGNEAAVFLESIMFGLQPPVCENRNRRFKEPKVENSSSNLRSHRIIFYFFQAVFALILLS